MNKLWAFLVLALLAFTCVTLASDIDDLIDDTKDVVDTEWSKDDLEIKDDQLSIKARTKSSVVKTEFQADLKLRDENDEKLYFRFEFKLRDSSDSRNSFDFKYKMLDLIEASNPGNATTPPTAVNTLDGFTWNPLDRTNCSDANIDAGFCQVVATSSHLTFDIKFSTRVVRDPNTGAILQPNKAKIRIAVTDFPFSANGRYLSIKHKVLSKSKFYDHSTTDNHVVVKKDGADWAGFFNWEDTVICNGEEVAVQTTRAMSSDDDEEADDGEGHIWYTTFMQASTTSTRTSNYCDWDPEAGVAATGSAAALTSWVNMLLSLF